MKLHFSAIAAWVCLAAHAVAADEASSLPSNIENTSDPPIVTRVSPFLVDSPASSLPNVPPQDESQASVLSAGTASSSRTVSSDEGLETSAAPTVVNSPEVVSLLSGPGEVGVIVNVVTNASSTSEMSTQTPLSNATETGASSATGDEDNDVPLTVKGLYTGRQQPKGASDLAKGLIHDDLDESNGTYAAASSTGVSSTVRMSYRGGTLMVQTTDVYLIYYGDWTNRNSTKNVVEQFIQDVSSSDWWKLTTNYTNGKGSSAARNINLKGVFQEGYSVGPTLTESSKMPFPIASLILRVIKNYNINFAPDQTIFAIVSSPDIAENKFCTSYCGYHKYFTTKTLQTPVKYAFVGDPLRCPGYLPGSGTPLGVPGCLQSPLRNTTTSINGDQSGDGIANVMAHELAETVTDPEFDAWLDANGDENADKCNGRMGSLLMKDTSTNQLYNVEIGSRKYLIQQQWDLQTQRCVIAPL